MELKEFKKLLHKYFIHNKDLGNFDLFYSDRKIKLFVLTGKKKVYSGLYVYLVDGYFGGCIRMNLEYSDFKLLDNDQQSLFRAKNLEKFNMPIDLHEGLSISYRKAEEIILEYLKEFKEIFEETINEFGCMMYTEMYVSDGKDNLIPIKDN